MSNERLTMVEAIGGESEYHCSKSGSAKVSQCKNDVELIVYGEPGQFPAKWNTLAAKLNGDELRAELRAAEARAEEVNGLYEIMKRQYFTLEDAHVAAAKQNWKLIKGLLDLRVKTTGAAPRTEESALHFAAIEILEAAGVEP